MGIQKEEWLQSLNLTNKKLSKSHVNIMNYIADNYEKAMNMTTSALAKNCKSTASTVARLATAMGYDGYPSFQKALCIAVKQRMTTQQRVAISAELNTTEMLRLVLKTDVQNIKETINTLDVEMFEKVISCLLLAKNIYIIGKRSSAPIALFLHHYLRFLFPNVHLLHNSIDEGYDALMRIDKEDVLFAISFPRYSKFTINSMNIAKDEGAKVVALTDNNQSPLCKVSDYVLFATSDMSDFVDSLVAPLSLIHALVACLGLQRKETLSAHFQKLEALWNVDRVYIDKNDE